MAKFNIEVELDWMDEEAYSIDDELRERIVKGVEILVGERGDGAGYISHFASCKKYRR